MLHKLMKVFELTNAQLCHIIEEDLENAITALYKEAKQDLGYTNYYSFGGDDVIMCVEKKNANWDVLIIQNMVSFFDKSNYVISIENMEDGSCTVRNVLAVYDDEAKNNFSFGDFRDYEQISVKTLMDNDWNIRKVGYADTRSDHFIYEKGFFSEEVSNKASEYSHGFHQGLFHLIHEVEYIVDQLEYKDLYSVNIYEKSEDFWG